MRSATTPSVRAVRFLGIFMVAARVFYSAAAAANDTPLRFVDSPAPMMLDCGLYSGTPCFRVEVYLANGFDISRPNFKSAIHIQFDDVDGDVFCVTPSVKVKDGGIRYSLILIDISGSMKTLLPNGEMRFEAAKMAARTYLQNFDPKRDRIAVVPFESHQVIKRIREATFASSAAGVNAQIDRLPTPVGNTGLYAAVSAALERLNTVRKAMQGAEAELVLLTDGRNDVQPGDDRELSDPGTDISTLLSKITEYRIPIVAVGLGLLNDENAMADLQEIGSQKSFFFVNDAKELEDVFAGARRLQTERLRITFKCPSDKSRLGGKNHTIAVTIDSPDRKGLTAQTQWIPPDLLAPAFEGKTDVDENTALMDEASSSPSWWRSALQPILVFAVWSAALLTFWFIIPRFIWPERYMERYAPVGAPGNPGASMTARSAGPTSGPSQAAPQARNGSDETIVTDRRFGTKTGLK